MNVMIAGAGGNNSWLVHNLDKLIKLNQIPETINFFIWDKDVVEIKNLLYQNFRKEDVTDNKATNLASRYISFFDVPEFVTKEEQFDKYDVVISGVDNPKFRSMLFKYMEKHPEKYWIDLRAEGRMVALYAKHKKNTLDKMLATLPKNEDITTSCQLSYELEAGIIQYGNQIAAAIATQYFLNFIRDIPNPPEFVRMI